MPSRSDATTFLRNAPQAPGQFSSNPITFMQGLQWWRAEHKSAMRTEVNRRYLEEAQPSTSKETLPSTSSQDTTSAPVNLPGSSRPISRAGPQAGPRSSAEATSAEEAQPSGLPVARRRHRKRKHRGDTTSDQPVAKHSPVHGERSGPVAQPQGPSRVARSRDEDEWLRRVSHGYVFTGSREPSQPPTSTSGRRLPPCVFCSDPGHPSAECHNLRSLRARASTLARNRRCMICLGDHYGPCVRGKRCWQCDQYGHHQAVCVHNPHVRVDIGVPEREFYGCLHEETYVEAPPNAPVRQPHDVHPPRHSSAQAQRGRATTSRRSPSAERRPLREPSRARPSSGNARNTSQSRDVPRPCAQPYCSRYEERLRSTDPDFDAYPSPDLSMFEVSADSREMRKLRERHSTSAAKGEDSGKSSSRSSRSPSAERRQKEPPKDQ